MTAKINSEEDLTARAVSDLDDDFNRGEFERRRADGGDPGQTPARSAEPAGEPPGKPDIEPKASAFRQLVGQYERSEVEQRQEARREAAEARQRAARELIGRHVSDRQWRDLLDQAQQAAGHGRKEFVMTRFPGEVCTDGGRAINAAEADWPKTLRGEPAELFQRAESELKPQGFRIIARVLEFPDGVPGDIGLILAWGG